MKLFHKKDHTVELMRERDNALRERDREQLAALQREREADELRRNRVYLKQQLEEIQRPLSNLLREA